MVKKTFPSQWKHYKEWCLEEGLHPWLSFDRTQVTIEFARDQLMASLGYIKPSMHLYSNFCNHKSAVAKGFRVVFGFELGTNFFITQWIKGWKTELPRRPRHDPDEEGWDIGLIVQYWSTRPNNDELDTVELGYEALSLFAVSVCPESSTSLDQPVTSWTSWLWPCDSVISALRSFGRYRSLLGKLNYLGWINLRYVRSWL